MSQLEHTTVRTSPLTRVTARTFLALAAMATVVLVASVALAMSTYSPFAARSGQVQVNVTDGWMAGTSAIARALGATAAGPVTDGWASRYLPSARQSQVTDGWASRYLASARTHR